MLSRSRVQPALKAPLEPRDKVDGGRLIARQHAAQVRLWTRPGSDYSERFTRLREAQAGLPVELSCSTSKPWCFDGRGPATSALLLSEVRVGAKPAKAGTPVLAFILLQGSAGTAPQPKITVPFAVRGKSAQGGSISVRITTIDAALEVRRRMKELGATQVRSYRSGKQSNTVSRSGTMLPDGHFIQTS